MKLTDERVKEIKSWFDTGPIPDARMPNDEEIDSICKEVLAARKMRDKLKPKVHSWHTDYFMDNSDYMCGNADPMIEYDIARNGDDG